jgi:hypothetical protein
VKVAVETEFGNGSRIEGLVVFTYPCAKIVARITVELRAPLPHMDAEAKLTAYCGEAQGFELEFTVKDLEVAPGVNFAHVNAFLGVVRSEETLGMWAINATLLAVGNGGDDDRKQRELCKLSANKLKPECDDGGPAQLKWRGRLMFWTGPTEVLIEAEVLPLPPPPPPELPVAIASDFWPPPYTNVPPAPLDADCCNGLDPASVPAGKCCDPGTLRLLSPGQSEQGAITACTTSRWCNMPDTDCLRSVQLLPVSKTCLNDMQPPVEDQPLEPMPPPLLNPPVAYPPPPKNECSEENMIAGCACGSEGGGLDQPDNPFESSGLCCDQPTKKTEKGAQVTSWAWCVKYSPPPRPPPPVPPPPSPPPADVCSTGKFFAGCKQCGITIGVDCPPETTGLCCHKATKVAVQGARAMSSRWCGSSVEAPSRRHLLTGDSEIDEFTSPSATPETPEGGAPEVSVAQCCNANHAEDFKLISAAQCCDPDTLTLVDGGTQCQSTRWCRAKDCVAAPKIPTTQKCALASTPAVKPPAPPAPAEVPDVTTPVPILAAQCCNANGDDWQNITAGECCDQDTLSRVPGGEQCMSSRWCKMKDCIGALTIDGAKKAAGGCVADSPHSTVEDDDRSNGTNATNVTAAAEQEEEDLMANITLVDDADTGALTRVERTYEIEAEVDVFYDDGNVQLELHGELVIGAGCTEYQLLADVEVRIADPAMNATGDVVVSCPDEAGGRTFGLNVTLWEWQIADGIKVGPSRSKRPLEKELVHVSTFRLELSMFCGIRSTCLFGFSDTNGSD